MDNSPTAHFDTYDQDFRQILDSVRSKLDGDGKDERGGEDNAHLCGLTRPYVSKQNREERLSDE
ncbi:hypothetical protein J3R82DRAFT_4438 [Butyriboletus roseoflavus]|nr:hypothetical protein J3R82DRAFT_4438 [Butyriboletus roseoflavus]